MNPATKASMCGRKASFRSWEKANAIAQKFGQRVYECPLCFCFHCTTSANWRDDFVTKEYMERRLACDVATERNKAKRLAAMLRSCVADLRGLDAHDTPKRAEILLAELGY